MFFNINHIISFIGSIGVFGNILFGIVWCFYFLFRINVLRKKVYYLKKQTNERCLNELTNAKVEYIKSIFIAAISASEVLGHVCFVGVLTYQNLAKSPKNSCGPDFLKYSEHHLLYRMIAALANTSVIVFISLIHILTSYLSHAYSEKRHTNIMRREGFMFAWLFIQLVCVWSSIFYWPLFILTLPGMALIALISHLCLYWKYGRELYSEIRRRERDALFESKHSHTKLAEMLKSYKYSAYVYIFYVLLFSISLIIAILIVFIQNLLDGDCQTEIFFHLNIHILKTRSDEWFKRLDKVDGILALLTLLSLFLIHVSIMYKVIRRMFRRRRAMNNPTRFNHSTLFQPLVGNK